MSRSLYWVNAFTTEPFTGNPAVVVPDASDFSEHDMQSLAREMNCSETAFVLRPTETEADFRLRWFTPTQEVPLCGHATIATLHVLAKLGQYNLKPGFQQILYIETLSGVLSATVDYRQSDPAWIWLALPNCQFQPLDNHLRQQLQAILPTPIQSAVVDSLNQDVLIQISSLNELAALTPESELLKNLGEQEHWRGFSVFTTDTHQAKHDAHLRFFAPQAGIAEDPVTGSASGPLALFLKQNNLANGDRLIIEQGHCLNRPGHIHVDLTEGTPRCGGQAVTVLEGVLND